MKPAPPLRARKRRLLREVLPAGLALLLAYDTLASPCSPRSRPPRSPPDPVSVWSGKTAGTGASGAGWKPVLLCRTDGRVPLCHPREPSGGVLAQRLCQRCTHRPEDAAPCPERSFQRPHVSAPWPCSFLQRSVHYPQIKVEYIYDDARTLLRRASYLMTGSYCVVLPDDQFNSVNTLYLDSLRYYGFDASGALVYASPEPDA